VIITGRELQDLKELKISYGSLEREKCKAICINGFIVNGVSKFKIGKRLFIVCGKNGEKLAQLRLDNLASLEINEKFGDYKFILKI